MKRTIITLILISISVAVFSQKPINIHGEGIALNENDTVQLILFKHGFDVFNKNLVKTYNTVIRNKQFDFRLTGIKKTTAITLIAFNGKNPFVNIYIEPGDDINICFAEKTETISGRKAEFFSIQHAINRLSYSVPGQHVKPYTLKQYYQWCDSLSQLQLEYLNAHKSLITPFQIKLIERDIKNLPTYYVMQSIDFWSKTKRPDWRDSVAAAYSKALKSKLILTNDLDSQFYSPTEVSTILFKFRIDSCFMMHKVFQLSRFLTYVVRNYKNFKREQLITYAMLHEPAKTESDIVEAKLALQFVRNIELNHELSNNLHDTANGANAYNFKLKDGDGRFVSLADFKGQPVVLDFWFTGCGACRILAPYMHTIAEEFADKGVKFVTVSIDKNMKGWKKSILSGDYTTTGNINLYTNGNGENDAIIKRYNVAGFPSLFLIDKNGKLINVETRPDVDGGIWLTKRLNQLL